MSATGQIKVSVIIPFYGVEKYIEQCLESVTRQTLREIEIICIDDASPDDSATIVRRFAATDQRIRLIRNPVNRGVSVARNLGLSAARGDYLYVIDSDDFLHPEAIGKLHAKATQDDLDLVFSDA
ncbi:MAG TPA: glycosyltransferase family 2 protein, partial [Luteolibacter sp.]|nr:glycosyltransferase family 2 protein [Luteolibacter sp.]